jgi:hypothetical protein
MSKEITNPIEYAKEIVGRDPMAVFLGITVEEVRQGFARCSLVIKPDYLNSIERMASQSMLFLIRLAVAANMDKKRSRGKDFL